MWCKDPLLDALKQYGYNVVRLPRSGIKPLQILMRNGSDLDRLGELTTILMPGPTPPPITEGIAANISGDVARTGNIEANAGIPVLGNVVAAMGGSSIGLEAKYAGAKSLAFEFLDVKEASVEVAALDQFLGQSKVNAGNVQVKKLLDADAVYVITSVIKSAKLNVAAKTSGDKALTLDAGQLAKALGAGGKVSVTATDQQSSTMQYAGQEALAFGFQAVQLQFDKGNFQGFRVLPAGAASMRSLDPAGRDAPPREVPAAKSPQHVLLGGNDAPFVPMRDGADSNGGGAKQVRRGLQIGINVYPNLPAQNQLKGCVRDIQVMHGTLRDVFGFPAANLKVLTDKEATRDAILAAMDQLVRDTGPEDVVIIQYSGHGSQVKDREGDEPDGWDETIVPSDSGRGDKPNRDITDDEIYARLMALSLKTSNLTLLFDCCHSGTITRDTFGAAGRRLDRDERDGDQLPPASLVTAELVATLTSLHNTRDVGGSGMLPVSGSYVLIAGCRDEETSFEHASTEGQEVVTHGALTYFLHQELIKAAPGATYRDVYDQANPRVSAAYRTQHPQIEGAADRVLFGSEIREPGRFVLVGQPNGNEVTLAAGAAHGLTVGSVWAIYPPGTKSADPTKALGRATIAKVGGLSSVASLAAGFDPATIAIGARAAEESHDFGDLRLGVSLVDVTGGDGVAAREIVASITKSQLLRAAEADADARVYLLAERADAKPTDPVPQLKVIAKPTWAIVGRDGQMLTPPGAIGEPADRDRLITNLETIARFENARKITNPEPSELDKKVDMVLLRNDGTGKWVPAEPNRDGQVVFQDGEKVILRLVNNHTAPIYATVLDFGLTYRIFQIYPVQNSKPAQQTGSFEFGHRADEVIELGMPDNFGRPSGEEVFKLFATTAPSDFGWMQQGAVRDVPKGPMSALERLMQQALTLGTRDAKERPVPTSDSWTTVERKFTLMAAKPPGGL